MISNIFSAALFVSLLAPPFSMNADSAEQVYFTQSFTGLIEHAANSSDPDIKLVIWSSDHEKDPMTGETSSETLGEADFDDGVQIQVNMSFTGGLIGIDLNAFKDKQPIPLAYNNQKLAIRIRLDDGPVRTLNVTKFKFVNVANISFYDEQGNKAQVEADVAKANKNVTSDSDKMLLAFRMIAIPQMAAVTAGRIDELVACKSILVELRLNDGQVKIIDLNPRDDMFQSTVRASMSGVSDTPQRP